MAVMYHVCCFILAVVCTTTAQPQDYTPVCDPSDYTPNPDHPLPEFPEQFSFTIEAVMGGYINSTQIVSEYFDSLGNRARADFRVGGENRTDSTLIFDYNLQEVFVFPDFDSGDECRVYDIYSDIVNSTFGTEIRNGTLHIGSPVRFIESVRDETVVSFIGTDEIRGIPVMHWQACNSLPNNSYIVNYYFAPRSYDYNGESAKLTDDNDLIPIQFELIASRGSDYGVINFTNLYHFFNFKSGPDSVSDDVFAVPLGLRCKGRTPGTPPDIPDFFSVSLEGASSFEQRVTTVRETYDLQHKLFRADRYYDGSLGGPPGPSSVIHDFNIGVEYALTNNILGCVIQPLTGSPYFTGDIDLGEEQAPTLLSPNQLFLRGNEFNYSYEGVTTVRGIEADSWISVRDFEQYQGVNATNIVYEIFFTRPGWNVTSILSQTMKPIPLRLKLSLTTTFINPFDNSTVSTQTSTEEDVFDFSTNEPPYDAFDVSTCFGPDDYHLLNFAIPGYKEGVDYGLLRRDVRAAIVNLTKLRPTQIGKIEIRGDNSTHIFVATRLYNLTMHANIDPKTNVTANKAFNMIVNSLNEKNELPFTLTINNAPVNPILFHFGRGENASCNVSYTCNCSTCNTPTPSSSSNPSCSPSPNPTPSSSSNPSHSPSPNPTPSSSSNPSHSPSPNPTPSSSSNPNPSSSPSPKPIPTYTHTRTYTYTPSPFPIPIPSPSPVNTFNCSLCNVTVLETNNTCPTMNCSSCNVTVPDDNCNCSSNNVTVPDSCTMNCTCNVTAPETNTNRKNCTENITTQFKLTNGIVAGIAIGLFVAGFIAGLIFLLVCQVLCRWYRSRGSNVIRSITYKRHKDDIVPMDDYGDD